VSLRFGCQPAPDFRGPQVPPAQFLGCQSVQSQELTTPTQDSRRVCARTHHRDAARRSARTGSEPPTAPQQTRPVISEDAAILLSTMYDRTARDRCNQYRITGGLAIRRFAYVSFSRSSPIMFSIPSSCISTSRRLIRNLAVRPLKFS